MALRRSLSIRSTLSAHCYQLSPSYIITHDNDRDLDSSCQTQSQRSYHSFLHQRSSNHSVSSQMSRGCSHFSLFPTSGSAFYRYMSSAPGAGSDIADVLTDSALQAVASQAVVVSEVANAAKDSFFPIAALQHCIDMVHSFTGLDWWLSIVLATLLIRTMMVPLLIKQLKATTQLTLLRPRLEAVREDMQNKGMDPTAVAEGQKQMKALFKEYGVSPFTPMKGLLIQGPLFVFFFLAIRNMAEKVPSFQTGGALWFTDLTTPDSLYIFPVLTGLSFLITVECNAQEGMEGNPMAGTVKNVCRAFAVLTVPLTMSFQKAIFCYWITSNLFSLMYGLVIKRPQVKKVLGIPELPPPEPGSTPSFNLSDALKKLKEITQKEPDSSPGKTTLINPRARPPTPSPVNQRLKALESQVKKRKNKRR
ncbi:PREDICTED: mitochondrial inner membrane protein OXA1-like [Tarenaya hassleriana]|uniref:mitochondrial inner membrane protein OXA1-like n=1 Tax=Tarenaya hassleriana TaxID=28532 RepID=UPI00053C5650|nr:PREDICTED: mitochondrial inner membrane protein OXA1-like [Tarenaya hassleriana]